MIATAHFIDTRKSAALGFRQQDTSLLRLRLDRFLYSTA